MGNKRELVTPTAHRMWKRGELRGYQLSTGTIIIENV